MKSLLPSCTGKVIHLLKRGIYMTPLYRKCILSHKVRAMQKKERIRVLFIAYTAGMWKVDSLYEAMKVHERFEPEILLTPNLKIQDTEARKEEYLRLKSFFDKKGYHYIELCDIGGQTSIKQIPSQYDILFYPQSGNGVIPKALDMHRQAGRITICCDYAFHSGSQNWAFNKWYQNTSWIDCYENETTRQLSCKEKYNKGLNSYATGLPFVDNFYKNVYTDPWKQQSTPCKRIIWAPHWSIIQEHSAMPCYSNFLSTAGYMLSFAKSQIGHIQFAFKPHPWLRKELYKHPDWGKERTDAYYREWETGENTQLEQSGYVDLFMTSDAMVHDCSSFCCEYQLTGKPVFFMVRNEEKQTAVLNEMAHAAFYAQYLGHNIEDLQQFFKEQVIAGHDPMKEKRAEIVRKYLVPPHGKSAADNVINSILKAR